jgi:CubicO group peptidase (beta-lactamase class C family)
MTPERSAAETSPLASSPAAPRPPELYIMEGFAPAADVFRAQITRGLHYGAQFHVSVRGTPVLDLWGGSADAARKIPVRRDTPFMLFSATKAFTAASIHLLADRGLLDPDAPAADYWPEFAAHGKGGITIRHLLLHQAGIPDKPGFTDLAAWLVPGLPARRVAAMTPLHAPGAKTIYHRASAGFALGEIIRRVSGQKPAEFLRRNFLEPLGMEHSSAGLPFSAQKMASRIHSGDPHQDQVARVFSLPLYRRLYLPAASLNTTASDLARFYGMLCSGGLHDGRRLLSERIIAEATALRYEGPDGDTGNRVRWASGFGLGGYSPFPTKDIRHMGHGASEKTFGHSGQGGCAFGWADPASGLVFAFVCNRFLSVEAAHLRFQELSDAVWSCLSGSPGLSKK